jgi:hypothetical protein
MYCASLRDIEHARQDSNGPTIFSEKRSKSGKSAAQSGANSPPIDPELAAVEAWSRLSANQRTPILIILDSGRA